MAVPKVKVPGSSLNPGSKGSSLRPGNMENFPTVRPDPPGTKGSSLRPIGPRKENSDMERIQRNKTRVSADRFRQDRFRQDRARRDMSSIQPIGNSFRHDNEVSIQPIGNRFLGNGKKSGKPGQMKAVNNKAAAIQRLLKKAKSGGR